MATQGKKRHRVVILGGGFGGLHAAQHLGGRDVDVTLIDRRNFHLFQPLLYQVATGGLAPSDIASPLRAVLNQHKNVHTLLAEATGIDVRGRRIVLSQGEVRYDSAIIATGVNHHYFGHDDWAETAPGLKTLEEALQIRQRVFMAFEAAERERDPRMRRAWMTFVLIGGGPTGVELAGAIAELCHATLKEDFRRINPAKAEIVLVEGSDRILPTFHESLSSLAQRRLVRMGVRVRTQSLVTRIEDDSLTLTHKDKTEVLRAGVIIWAAGVKASPLGAVLSEATGEILDPAGRVLVQPDLTIPRHPELFVIGDLAHCKDGEGNALPGLAPVAMQQGSYAAAAILARLKGKPVKPFRYRHRGNLAVIGRNMAVGELGGLRISGTLAWLIWLFIHIRYLIEFDNKIMVLYRWGCAYFSRKCGARLITGARRDTA